MSNPKKILTVAQMNAVDRATIAAGIPGIILMENAAHRVVEYVAEHFAPVERQRIVSSAARATTEAMVWRSRVS